MSSELAAHDRTAVVIVQHAVGGGRAAAPLRKSSPPGHSNRTSGRGKAMRDWFRQMKARVESRFGMGDRSSLLSAWTGDGEGSRKLYNW